MKAIKCLGKCILLLLVWLVANAIGIGISAYLYPIDEYSKIIHDMPDVVFYDDGRF